MIGLDIANPEVLRKTDTTPPYCFTKLYMSRACLGFGPGLAVGSPLFNCVTRTQVSGTLAACAESLWGAENANALRCSWSDLEGSELGL